jgi:hypothetical protein
MPSLLGNGKLITSIDTLDSPAWYIATKNRQASISVGPVGQDKTEIMPVQYLQRVARDKLVNYER